MQVMLGPVPPELGGCWFCHETTDHQPDVWYSGEFDTYMHVNCVVSAYIDDPCDPETAILVRELLTAHPECARQFVRSDVMAQCRER